MKRLREQHVSAEVSNPDWLAAFDSKVEVPRGITNYAEIWPGWKVKKGESKENIHQHPHFAKSIAESLGSAYGEFSFVERACTCKCD